jgi:hypothetical protein
MRKGSKANLVRELREIGDRLNRAIDTVAMSDEKDHSFSVCWPGDEGTKIKFHDRWLQTEEAEDIAAGAIWALFESTRPGDDPSHAGTFDDVMTRVMKIAESRCHQRPRSAKATK